MTDELPTYNDVVLSQKKELPRGIDFVSPLWLQRALNGDADVFYYKGRISMKTNADVSSEEQSTEFGETCISPDNRRHMEYIGGVETPFNRDEASFDTVTIEEMYKDMYNNLGVNNISTVEIGIMHPSPRNVDILNTSERVAEFKVARGNRSTNFKKQTEIETLNRNSHRDDRLVEEGIVQSDDISEVSKRAKSSLVTDAVCSDTGLTLSDFDSVSLMRSLMHFQEGNILQDIARPESLQFDDPRIDEEGMMYKLTKLDELTPL